MCGAGLGVGIAKIKLKNFPTRKGNERKSMENLLWIMKNEEKELRGKAEINPRGKKNSHRSDHYAGCFKRQIKKRLILG